MLLGPIIEPPLGSACKLLLPSYQMDFCKTSPYFPRKWPFNALGTLLAAGPGLAPQAWQRQCFKMLLKLDMDPSPWSGQTVERMHLGHHI